MFVLVPDLTVPRLTNICLRIWFVIIWLIIGVALQIVESLASVFQTYGLDLNMWKTKA